MAITYTSNFVSRPYGTYNGMLLPLVLRNPTGSTGVKDKDKDGVSPVLKFGPRDYRMWLEGLNAISPDYSPNTNFELYATSPDGCIWTKNSTAIIDPRPAGWEQGEVCFSTVLWNPDSNGGEFWAYYHGGNNAGPRQIALMTSPTGLPGTWQRYGSSPILNAVAGGWENSISDAYVVRLAKGDWRMLYAGYRSSDGRGQTGYATSRDGKNWTKYASNPVIAFGSTNEAHGCYAGWGYVDELGRVHYWYCGQNASDVLNVCYAYSDNWTTWTRDEAAIISKSATSTDPDGGGVGDSVRGVVDDGQISLTCVNFNASTYSGDGLGRLEGRGVYHLPKRAAATPARTARWFKETELSYVNVPTAAAVGSQNIFSVYGEFKCFQDRTAARARTLYNEDLAFNALMMIELESDGSFKGGTFYRTTTGTQTGTFATTAWDDNQYHWFLFRRTSSTAAELIVDGTSMGTIAVQGTFTATSVTVGGVATTNHNFTGTAAGANGIVRRIVTISGYAMTNLEAATIWNNGNDHGTLPSSGTLNLDLHLGSGGVAGPDVDLSPNAYSCSLVIASGGIGTALVDGGVGGRIIQNRYVKPRGRRLRR